MLLFFSFPHFEAHISFLYHIVLSECFQCPLVFQYRFKLRVRRGKNRFYEPEMFSPLYWLSGGNVANHCPQLLYGTIGFLK